MQIRAFIGFIAIFYSDILYKGVMASRCISTLNDLDKISDRIYYKHSKVSFMILHDHDGKVR